ncbi:MAG: hypothetical protein M3378_09100 [Actinomycetota bacterium]|nr:hypothetical protein [Actinomycetota bacterium]
MALLRATHLVDKSALARMTHPTAEARLRPLLEEGAVATCPIIDLEVLYSARDLAAYDAIRAERRALDEVPRGGVRRPTLRAPGPTGARRFGRGAG